MNTYHEIEEALDTYGRPCLNNPLKLCSAACEHYHRIPGIIHEGAYNLQKAKKSSDAVQAIRDAAEDRERIAGQEPPPLEAQLVHLIALERVEKGERAGCLQYPEVPVTRRVRSSRKTRR